MINDPPPSYRPLRKQMSVTQRSNNIFGQEPQQTVKPQTKVNYPRKETNPLSVNKTQAESYNLKKTPDSPFVPKFREQSIQDRRQRDFIGATPVQYRAGSRVPSAERSGNPRQAHMSSNIFGIPEKDILNKEMFSQPQSKSQLLPTHGKSVTHPWLLPVDRKLSQALDENPITHLKPQPYVKQEQPPKPVEQEPQQLQQRETSKETQRQLSFNKYHGRNKTDLISASQAWTGFDPELHGRALIGQTKTEHPLPTHGYKRSLPQADPREPLCSLLNQDTTPQKVQNKDVNVVELDLKGPVDERQLRDLCRQTGYHLVKYEDQYNRITNHDLRESRAVVRTNTQSINTLQQSLDQMGVKVRQHSANNGHKAMYNQVWVQQEQQRKELEELEHFYKEQTNYMRKNKTKHQ